MPTDTMEEDSESNPISGTHGPTLSEDGNDSLIDTERDDNHDATPRPETSDSSKVDNNVSLLNPRKKQTILNEDATSSSESSFSDTSDEDRLVNRNSRLRSELLCASFSQKYNRDYGAQTNEKKASRLAKNLIGYIGNLESRIRQLEGKDERGSEEQSDSEPDHEPKEFVFEIKLYEAAPEIFALNFDMSRESKANTYRSEVDPRHFIRAAFNWTKERRSTNRVFSGKELPSAEDVEIIALRIESPNVRHYLPARIDILWLGYPKLVMQHTLIGE